MSKIFLLFCGFLILIGFGYLKYKYEKYETFIQQSIERGKLGELRPNDLITVLGKPRFDEIQSKKKYNQGGDEDFNCTPPFRFLGFNGGVEILAGGKLEDNLYFYFDKNGKYCYFERLGL